MKLRCGHRDCVKWRARRLWHPWYAWYPVRVGPLDCRWLVTVQRKLIIGYFGRSVYREYKP